MRVSHEGNSGLNGGPRGDAYVDILVKRHPLFEREGDDIYIELPISYSQAVLGDKVTVPTMQGKVEMKIPPGAQPGTKMRLREKGLQLALKRQKKLLFWLKRSRIIMFK